MAFFVILLFLEDGDDDPGDDDSYENDSNGDCQDIDEPLKSAILIIIWYIVIVSLHHLGA